MLGFTKIQLYKIFLAIKARHRKHGIVGFSRLEASRFGVSERRLQYFINALRKDKKLVKSGMVKGNNNPFKCNIYKLSKEFIDFLDTIKDFVKKEFEYIKYTPDDVINYVSNFAKKKYNQWKFERNGIKYVVNDKGKWRGKILDTMNQKIVSLITIQKLGTKTI